MITNEVAPVAQRNYESVGCEKIAILDNKETPFVGKYIDV